MNDSITLLCKKLEDDARSQGIEKFVVGTAVIKNEAVLIVFRSETDDFLAGYGELPGGGVDPGETLIDAVHRETLEETGLVISKIVGYCGGFDYVSGSGKKTRQFNFIVTTTSLDVQLNPDEHSRYIWLPLDDAEQLEALPMTPEMRASIRDIKKSLQDNQEGLISK